MPNWNEAIFEVVGDKEIIDVILKTGFDFDKIRPEPKDIMKQPDVSVDYGGQFKDLKSPAWYQWRLKNWGTKWKPTAEIGHLELDRVSDIKLKVRMDTAWCLPVEILKFITTKYPIQITGTSQEENDDKPIPFVVDKGVIKAGI